MKIEEIRGRYKDKHQQYNNPIRMWDDMQIVLEKIKELEERTARAECEGGWNINPKFYVDKVKLEETEARIRELETERRRNALDGQCALDEANNRIKELEERVKLAEATREDALAYAKGYKNGQMQLQQMVGDLMDVNTKWASRVKELEAIEKLSKDSIMSEFDKAEKTKSRIKELENQLKAIKGDPSIGKLIVEDWPESPDY